MAAQRPIPVRVRVTVTDSLGSPVPGAEVSVVRGVNQVVSIGTADQYGERVLTATLDSSPTQIVARRVGFERGSRFFSTGGRDTVSVHVVMTPVAHALATVTVTAEQDMKRKYLYIDADGIANSPRRLDDAFDIIKKIRPDMVTGLGRICPPLADIWVNGRLIYPEFVTINDMAIAQNRGLPTRRVAPHVISALTSIRPEHIEEMTYNDCMNLSLIGKLHGENAVFVILKPGIGFDPARGSYLALPGDTTAVRVPPE